MIRFLKKLYLSEKGATAIEYGLIVGLIAVTIIVAISNVGNSTGNMWNHVSDRVVESSENASKS